jgi:hypothetical protein
MTKASFGLPIAKIPEFKAGFELLSFMAWIAAILTRNCEK